VERHVVFLLIGIALSSCVVQPPLGQNVPPSAETSTSQSASVPTSAQQVPDNGVALAAARRECAAQYPAVVGRFLARATCVNQAINRIALPTAANPDLIQLQENARIALSTKLDERTISQKAAEAAMAQIDAKVTSVEHYRAISDQNSAATEFGSLNDLVASIN